MQRVQVLLRAVSQQTGSPEKVSAGCHSEDSAFNISALSVRMRVKKLPMILALHLKRFKYMDQLHRYTKLSYRVVFPLELRLFNTSGDATNPDRMYDLVAVVVHCGRWDIPTPVFTQCDTCGRSQRLVLNGISCFSSQRSQPRSLHHHHQESRLLAAV